MFIADDLGAWLIGLVADAARKKLINLVRGDELDRALRASATTAIERTAAELCPDEAEHAAAVINQVFHSVPGTMPTRQTTMLGGLQAGIASRMAVLDDATLTGVGVSAADVLGVPATTIAETLATNLTVEITSAGVRGGPLEPLANLLSHDRAYLQAQETQHAVQELGGQILTAIAPLAAAQQSQLAKPAPAPDIRLHVDQAFEGLGLDQHDEAERRLSRLFMHLSRAQQRAAVAAILGVATTTDSHTTQLVSCNLLEAADRLDPMLIEIEDLEQLASASTHSLRGCAAVVMWQWAETIPGRVPIPLLGKLTQPSNEDWYVHSPARAGARELLLLRAAARAIFDRMAASRDRHDRDYAIGDLHAVAEIEPRAVPKDLARRLARDEVEDVATRGVELLRMLDGLTDEDRFGYYHRFGI